MNTTLKDILLGTLYFLLSTIITAWFILNKYWLYSDVMLMVLSGSIAGAKWGIQLITALVWLKENKWAFIRRIGFVCFIGSCVLLSYNLMSFISLPIGGFSQFVWSVALSILTMIVMYYKAVKKTGLAIRWYTGWLVCLAIAVFLQLKIVFHVI